MNRDLFDELVRVARGGNTTTYGNISPLIGIHEIHGDADVAAISAELDAVSVHEHQQGQPLLSVLVVNQHTLRPGPGFFTMARRLGRFRRGDQDSFFIEELNAVHDFWRNHAE